MSFKENFSIYSNKNASQLSQVSGRQFKLSGVAAVALAACSAVPAMGTQSYHTYQTYLTPPGTKHICRVASDAPKANNNLPDAGSSWAKAYRSLGKALDNYQSCREIWIKVGTYDTSDWHPDEGVTVRGGQKLLGGFKGVGFPDTARWGNPTETVLDGDRYAYHTVILKGDINKNTLFENLTISGGQADGKVDKYKKGGGIFCFGGSSSACSPTFNRVQFLNNEADSEGGAVYLSSAKDVSPTFMGVAFIGNESGRNGGAVAIENRSSSNVAQINFEGSFFGGNDAYSVGGAIYTTSSYHTGSIQTNIIQSYFLQNSAQGGAVIYPHNSGMIASWNKATNHTTLEDSEIRENSSPAGVITGGGLGNSIDIIRSKADEPNSAPLGYIHVNHIENSIGWN